MSTSGVKAEIAASPTAATPSFSSLSAPAAATPRTVEAQRQLNASKKRALSAAAGDDEADEEESSSKRPKPAAASSSTSSAAAGNGGSSDPNTVFLGGSKRIQVSKFKSFVLVDIRETYTDKTSGEERPGKKGISLKPEQSVVCFLLFTWRALARQLSEEKKRQQQQQQQQLEAERGMGGNFHCFCESTVYLFLYSRPFLTLFSSFFFLFFFFLVPLSSPFPFFLSSLSSADGNCCSSTQAKSTRRLRECNKERKGTRTTNRERRSARGGRRRNEGFSSPL